VIIAGNMTRDPETRTTQSGNRVVKIGIAVNRKFKDQESTCFVDCTAFAHQAEAISKYLRKGDPIFIEGRLDYQSWQAKDGTNRSKLEVIIEQFQFIGKAKPEDQQGATNKAPFDPEEVPF